MPNEVGAALGGGPLPAGLSDRERAVVDALKAYGQKGGMAYVQMLSARPQAMGYGMADSPAGLAAFMLVHPDFAEWSYSTASQANADPRRSAGQLHAVLAHQ